MPEDYDYPDDTVYDEEWFKRGCECWFLGK